MRQDWSRLWGRGAVNRIHNQNLLRLLQYQFLCMISRWQCELFLFRNDKMKPKACTFLLCCRLKSCLTCSDLSGRPPPSRVRAHVCRGCPCRDPRVCSHIQADVTTKRQPFACWLESCCSVMVVFVFVGVRNAFVCNWEYLHPCSTGRAASSSGSYSFLSRLVRSIRTMQDSLQSFWGLWVLALQFLIDVLVLLAVCNVAIHLFHFEKIDQLWLLSVGDTCRRLFLEEFCESQPDACYPWLHGTLLRMNWNWSLSVSVFLSTNLLTLHRVRIHSACLLFTAPWGRIFRRSQR